MLEAKRKMGEAQCQLQKTPSDVEIHRIEPIIVKDYVRLAEVEESFLRKKSRLQWLNLGDKNSKFFFNSVKGFHSRNRILSIHDDNGMCLTDAREVKDTIVSYFHKFLWGSSFNIVLDSSMLYGEPYKIISLSLKVLPSTLRQPRIK
jgi:hypothetical protein